MAEKLAPIKRPKPSRTCRKCHQEISLDFLEERFYCGCYVIRQEQVTEDLGGWPDFWPIEEER